MTSGQSRTKRQSAGNGETLPKSSSEKAIQFHNNIVKMTECFSFIHRLIDGKFDYERKPIRVIGGHDVFW